MPTAHFQQSRALPSARIAQAALNLLHNYDQLIQCQPLVGPVEKLSLPNGSAPAAIQAQVSEAEKSPDHTWYQQTEHVPILPFGLLKKKVVFYNWFRNLSDSTSLPSSLSASASASPPASGSAGPAGVDSSTAESEPKDGVKVLGGVESICYAPSSIKIYAVFRVEKKQKQRQQQGEGQGRQLESEVRIGTGTGTVVSARNADALSRLAVGDGAVHGGGSGEMTSLAPVTVQCSDGDGDDDQGWKIVEETEMTCPNWLILQFSERQHKAAHEKMLDAIVHEAQKGADMTHGNGS